MIGKKIFDYIIQKKIGSGNVGVVYQAEDTRQMHPVALKFIREDLTPEPEDRKSLVQRLQPISGLDHPHIGTVYDIHESEGQVILAMEFIEGDSLKDYLSTHTLSPEEVLEFAVQIAGAMADAHDLGIIHGSLTAKNVMILPEGNIKILDFGLTQALIEQSPEGQREELAAATMTLTTLTPGQDVDDESVIQNDIISIGALLYEMITGQPLEPAKPEADVTATLKDGKATAVITLDIGIPGDLDQVMRRALGEDPEQRYYTARELFIALQQLKNRTGEAEAAETGVKAKPSEMTIGNYRILRKLGEGGMGVVYEAEQQHPRRPVALKVIRGGHFVDEYQVKLFQREVQALARLKHPGIASIYEAGCTEAGQHFFAMELVPGIPLTDYVKGKGPDSQQQALGINQRLELYLEICDALNYAHQRGVIHRDLKPSNIFVVTDSGSDSLSRVTLSGPNIKILDFGLARIEADAEGATVVSEVGQIKGTLPYMSPEQVQGDPDAIDVRSDVYALGVILYELLTDLLPYDVKKTTLTEAIRVICEQIPRLPSRHLQESGDPNAYARKFNRDVETIALKALEKDPERRYQSVAALAEDMERYLSNKPILARPPSTWYQFRKLVSRHKTLFSFIAVLFLVLVGFAVTMTVQSARIARERDRAVAAEKLEAEQRERAEQARNAEREQRLQAESNLERALEAEKIAADEAQRARFEANTANQVLSFLVGLFEVSDPSEARGKQITAREILDQGAEKIREELKGQPTIQARLMNTMGTIYQSLGLYDSAAPLLETSLNIRQRELGPDHLDVATSLNDLAGVLYYKGDYEKAESLFRRALAIRRQKLGNDHPDVALSLNNLALVLKVKGDYERAESLFRQALALWRKLLGAEHPGLAKSLNNLAVVLKEKGDYDGAEKLYREALAMRRKLHGNDHPDVATSLNDLAVVLKAKGDFGEAEKFLREALAIRRKVLGKAHPDLATSLNDLAVVLEAKGDYAGAEKLYRESLDMGLKLLGRDHPDVITSQNNLALVLEARGEYDEAEALFREVLAFWRQQLGEKHPNVATSLNNLAMVLEAKGEYGGAEGLYTEALTIWRELLGGDHPNVATTLNNLALVLEAQGEYARAEAVLQEAITIWHDLFGEEHQLLASSLNNLGLVMVSKGELEEAERIYREALAMRRKLLGNNHPHVALSLTRLGKLLILKEASQDGENILRQSLGILKKSYPQGHWRIAETESVLGLCLTSLGRFAEAEPLLLRSHSVLKEKCGERNKRTKKAIIRIIDHYEACDKPEEASKYRTMLKNLEEPRK